MAALAEQFVFIVLATFLINIITGWCVYQYGIELTDAFDFFIVFLARSLMDPNKHGGLAGNA